MPTTLIKRPLSPLDSEPLIPLPEDILCIGSDDEKTAEEHIDKRRRIEAQGQQYLRGRPLFILSAGLRGRLNDWVNPWKRKRRRNEDPERRRIPATPGELINAPSRMRNAQSILDQQSENYNAATAPKQDPQALSLKPRDFQNWSKSDLAQATKTSHKSPRKWLKSDNVFFRERARRRSRSPTPTPNTKPRDQALAILNSSARPPAKIPPNPQAARTVSGEPLPNPAYDSGFTPINKSAFPRNTKIEVAHDRLDPAKPPEAKVDNEELLYPSKVTVREMILDNAHEPIRQGHHGFKQEAGEQAGLKHRHIQAGNSSERSASLALEASLKDVSYEMSHGFSDSTGQHALAIAAQTNGSSAFEDTLQALPPSTNLLEFTYRYARKHNPLPPKDRPSFGETLEIAKAKAKAEMLEIANAKANAKSQEQEIRRLSFTASGDVKKSKSISRKRLEHGTGSPQQQQQRTSSLDQQQAIQTNPPTVGNDSMETVMSPRFMMSGGLSCENDDQPEAQIVPQLPVVFGLVASGSSTDLLETDKQSLKPQNIEEGDSYADLSTQAAILKARRSFQNANFPPVKTSSPRQQNEATTSAVSLSTHEAAKAAKEIGITHEPFREPSPTSSKPSAFDSHGDEPMSTQAMLDAMSPFALTTIKKKKRGPSIGPPLSPTSPTANPFPARSLSTSVTSAHVPSPSLPMSGTQSKPPSLGLTSYSVAPNSMLTDDMYQQDGQHPQSRYFDSSEWDLDAAIEDAGRFLGSWDVEQEARKEGLRGSAGGAGNGNDEERVMGERMRETRAGLVEG